MGAVAKIIDFFNPRAFVIENPEQSRGWLFLEHHYNLKVYKNKTYYSNYDPNFSLKPTIFYSNYQLTLKRSRLGKSNSKYYLCGDYDQRSSIPSLLIQDVINQLKGELYND